MKNPEKTAAISRREDDQLVVEYRSTSSLQPYVQNARTHPKKQVLQIVESVKAFGFNNPILIDENYEIIAGHGRLEAAKLLGLSIVPTIWITHLSDAQKQKLRLADNKIADNAGWDEKLLAFELKHIIEIDTDFDVTVTGFDAPEIDIIIKNLDEGDDSDKLDSVPPIEESTSATSLLGDLWQLGDHRLSCGDATKPVSFEHLLGDERAQMVITDPPFNVRVDGHVGGLGKTHHREFPMASGEMSETEFIDFLHSTTSNLAASSIDGSVHFIFMDWRHQLELLKATKGNYDSILNLCVWNKSNGGMGSFYRSKHELVFVFKFGRSPHINNVELGRHGRNRTNVWDYPGVNTFGNDRMKTLSLHPTVKPVALVSDAILDCSTRGSIVLDCFCGSGTTIIAAEQAGRRAYTMELDPLYVDVAVRRWRELGGAPVIHAVTGRTFDEIAEERSREVCHAG
ncbi:MAG: ParB N-terminal domain-containing protein [Rhodospirillales bacterium]|jgi:hypothetical protein|nr:ParB N-terminal domain-containing protein [Rhodospirillales bacterium]MBT4626611.1 ParB N-terminal domain-containing protein [Rhodospirillales bacterium]MBT6825145.1 ParB N-terminal domain-containing protein [Rhodospirillales bacterium]